jgi:uncharacterized phosphosugar-binding protein
MRKTTEYISNIRQLIDQVMETQLAAVDAAGAILAETLMNTGFVYTFGTGHSHMMAEEIFYRAGGLARVYPILEEALMLHAGAIDSTELERREGYAEEILSRYPCRSADCIVIASNSGRNAVTVEMATAARKRGMKVIALTNMTHSQAMASRHPSGMKLYQMADVVLDNQGCVGDASVYIPSIGRNVAPTSTVIGAMLLQAVVVSAVENMTEQGYIPEVFSSSNLDEGDEINDKILSDFRVIVKPL